MIALIHADDYVFDWPGHVFPVAKYRLLKQRLITEGIASPSDFEVPPMLDLEATRLVHDAKYLRRLVELTGDPRAALREFEIPISRQVVHAVLRHTSGTALACERALQRGAAVNLGGGFHHAFPDHGEGFCFINDIAFALRRLLDANAVQRAAVIDLDLHQGNGTARCFAGDARVFTFSIHQEDLYPMPKEQSSLDVGLLGGADDREYLDALTTHLPRVLAFQPELVVYVAGADPFEEDQLGDLKLTHRGFERRDEIVFGALRERTLPVAVVLAGGYARDVDDVVRIHTSMVRTLKRFYDAASSATA